MIFLGSFKLFFAILKKFNEFGKYIILKKVLKYKRTVTLQIYYCCHLSNEGWLLLVPITTSGSQRLKTKQEYVATEEIIHHNNRIYTEGNRREERR